jgi:hypothetical protein
VAGARVPARAVDLLHDDRGFLEAQPRAAIFLGDQRGEPARPGQRLDERLGIGAVAIDPAVVFVGKLGAKRADRLADLGVGVVASAVDHGRSP